MLITETDWRPVDLTIVIAIATFVGGILVTLVIARFVTPQHARRTRVDLDLREKGIIDPPQLGLPQAGIRIGNRNLEMLWILEVEVTNSGPRDFVPSDAHNPPANTRPRIEFAPGIKIPFDPTPLPTAGGVDVRLARKRGNTQELFVHIHRLPKGERATFQIVATDEPGTQRKRLETLEDRHVSIFRGAMTDVDVRCLGLLAPPPPLLTI